MWDDMDMQDAIADDAGPIVVKTVTRKTVDFVNADTTATRTVYGTVQPATTTDLKGVEVDYKLAYQLAHILTPDTVSNGELIEWGGADYKVVKAGPYAQFGFTSAVAEQVK